MSGLVRLINPHDWLTISGVLVRVLPPGDSADEYARDLRQRLSAVLTETT